MHKWTETQKLIRERRRMCRNEKEKGSEEWEKELNIHICKKREMGNEESKMSMHEWAGKEKWLMTREATKRTKRKADKGTEMRLPNEDFMKIFTSSRMTELRREYYEGEKKTNCNSLPHHSSAVRPPSRTLA